MVASKMSLLPFICGFMLFAVLCLHSVVWGSDTEHRNTAWVDNAANGVVQVGEGWDNNLPGWFACQPVYGYHCTNNVWSTLWGDGMLVSDYEEWDDKNHINGDGWDSNCKVETGWYWTTGTRLKSSWKSIWGDGILISTQEQWDDGNTEDFDGCTSECDILDYAGRFSCKTNPTAIPATVWIDNWGDGFNVNKNLDGSYSRGKTDYWDDGNNKNGDGWSSSCSIEFGFSWTGGNLIRTDHCTDVCGDGLVVGGRTETEWDDANYINGDGCDSNCKVEKDYAWDGGSSNLKDRWWYYLHYRPAIKAVNVRSNGYIAILINDTVITHSGYFTSDEIGITVNDEMNYNSSVSFDSKVYYGSKRIIILKILPKQLFKGGKYSVLNLDFKNKVMYSELLRLIQNTYSIQLKENPTQNKIGAGIGISFEIIFCLWFLLLWVLIIADSENLCVIGIIGTSMQRIFMILLTNCRPYELLASFWTYFGVVSFKTSYFNYLYKIQINEIDIAMSNHKYNALGWFGFETPIIINNSAGWLSLISVLTFVLFVSYMFIWCSNIIFSKEALKRIFKGFVTSIPKVMIIIQALVINDMTLSVFINLGNLKFSNKTEIYSSSMWIIIWICLFSGILIPLGLISSHTFKELMTEVFTSKFGIYYQSILTPPAKGESFPFISYYSVTSLLYSVFFSIIIISFGSDQYLQLSLVTILNAVYLILACFRPYNQRFLNIINILNHIGVFACSILICSTLGVSSYDNYPLYASIFCSAVIIVIFLTFIPTMTILFIRLFFPFIKGVKKGFKFNKIVHYSKEDKEAVAPEVVLPSESHAGHIRYDDSYIQRYPQSEQALSASHMTRPPLQAMEESKERDLGLRRKQAYMDVAV